MLRHLLPLLFVVLLAHAASAAEIRVPGQAQIGISRGGASDTGLAPSAQRGAISPTYRLQCWQDGVKVIDQDGLFEISPNAVSYHQAISFKSTPGGAKTTFLLTTPDSLCLIKTPQ